ncbi:Scarecrow-like protein 9 [Castilleja foliolosa]|uniref:Scarecrow-like protein 9 n=1 Tax=Castilleja foliolosa TaxID=1961234 RepID=A0ABD3EC28_9LAMI
MMEDNESSAREISFYEVLGIGKKYSYPQCTDDSKQLHVVDDENSGGKLMLDINCVLAGNPKGDHGIIKVEKNRDENDKGIVKSHVPKQELDDVLPPCTVGGERRQKLETRSKTSGQAKKGSIGRRVTKMEVIDLRSLLIDCAKSIAADDRLAADDFLKQIRQHSSPFGDGNQRLAHYFADGLEARLAGTGSQIHKSLIYKLTITYDYLRAYHTFLESSPFGAVSFFAANKLMTIKSKEATRVHVIDFGIHFGFQWPTFIQSLAEREGGPPKLRITGIDFPQAGADRIQETGRRLAHYAETFNVPFEYNVIAQDWETIKVEDLKIDKDEFVAVNCLYRAQNLRDEIGLEDSSRTMVLNLIRKINPGIFIHGIVNGSYGVPFFLTRFREALFRFSAVYDMLETNIPRESPERMLIETGIFGKEALNVIACEGWERVERPETYKQWRMRHLRSGFVQIPFERELIDSAMYKVKKFYHREFVIDEDIKWLLMGWKGRTIYAMSCWQPAV